MSSSPPPSSSSDMAHGHNQTSPVNQPSLDSSASSSRPTGSAAATTTTTTSTTIPSPSFASSTIPILSSSSSSSSSSASTLSSSPSPPSTLSSRSRLLPASPASGLKSRPRSGSLPMSPFTANTVPATSSSLRQEILPDMKEEHDHPSLSSSSTPLSSSGSTKQLGPSSAGGPSSTLRQVSSQSSFAPIVGRGRSGSITTPRPANLAFLASAPTSSSSLPGSSSSSSGPSASTLNTGSGSGVGSLGTSATNPRRRQTLASIEVHPTGGSIHASGQGHTTNSRDQSRPADFDSLQLDVGPPTSIDTWDPIIPDITVDHHDDLVHHSTANNGASTSASAASSSSSPLTHHLLGRPSLQSRRTPSENSLDNPSAEEEEKLISAYQILDLIIPDVSAAAAAAEAAEKEQEEEEQRQLEANQPQVVDTTPPLTSTSAVESTMSKYLKSTSDFFTLPSSSAGSSTPALAASALNLTGSMMAAGAAAGGGAAVPGAGVQSLGASRAGTPIPLFAFNNVPGSTLPITHSTTTAAAAVALGSQGITPSPPATLASRFRSPFSSRAFVPPSRPSSINLERQIQQQHLQQQGYAGGLLRVNPLQPGTGSATKSSFFDYRRINLLHFGVGSSAAPSVRSFDPNRSDANLTEGIPAELYEVDFNAKPDPVEEQARRLEKTGWGRLKKFMQFPGRDLDPRTRRPFYKFPSNNIKTTKYTLLTFLPVNLLFQFKRFYNIYFLLAAIFVVAEPSLSPVTQILPLSLVLAITAVKDGLEDYRRHKQDKQSNDLPCVLVRDGQYFHVKSKDIKPGDVLMIHKNDKIPADVLLLSTSMDEGGCFVETSELDGETNLKRKASLHITCELRQPEQISLITGRISTEMPNEKLARLDGRVKLHFDPAEINIERVDQPPMGSTTSSVSNKSTGSAKEISRGATGDALTKDTSSNSLETLGTLGRQDSATSTARQTSTTVKILNETVPVTMTNVALRGSWLKNTDWVYGVVLYAGVDTKMMRNLKNTGLKFSTMEAKLNRMIVAIFVFNAFLLIGSFCFAYIGEPAENYDFPGAWYTSIEGPEFPPRETNARLVVGNVMNYFVIYTFVIPISVFISVELCRVVQALWMIWDDEMKSYNGGRLSNAELEELAEQEGFSADAAGRGKSLKKDVSNDATITGESQAMSAPGSPNTNIQKSPEVKITIQESPVKKSKKFWKRGKDGNKKKKPAKNWTRMHVRNSNLNEDLGSVEYIFSDKTGTLTRNVMKLAKWHIGGRTFHELQKPGSLGNRMRDPSISDEEYDLLMAFCRNIAVCHSVIPCLDTTTGELLYEAQSPDESALLDALKDNGVVLKSKTKDSVTVEIFGLITETYRILKVLEFTSDRKCMSVIIDTPQGIQLFCKGADNVIIARSDMMENEPQYIRHLESTVRRFSIAGLRTLMLAWRPLTTAEYERFDKDYSAAECNVGERDEEIERACSSIEGNLRLLGCTAIEDRLQDQVPETIEYLMEADIKLWLLTGDKQETAINIGISSRLISPAMKILVLNVKTKRDCQLVLEHFVERIKDRERDDEQRLLQNKVIQSSIAADKVAGDHVKSPSQEHAMRNLAGKERERFALVVNGESLAFVLGNDEFEDMFLRIGTSCHSVICCRVTPLQKALVVKLVRKKLHKVTLAIGDGANDISMIQAAHVGVGIEGMEGAQAARSSDFSFKQFKNLRRLLTIHGRYSYLRMSKIIFFSFYKSICLITVQFWFGFLSAWSGSSLYDEHFLTLWNMVFTALLPIVTACFEKDVDESMIERYPRLYKPVKEGLYWNNKKIFGWGVASFWHSGVLFVSLNWIFGGQAGGGVLDGSSQLLDFPFLNWIAGSLVLVTVTLKMLMHINEWTMPIFYAVLASMVGYMIVFIGLEIVGLLQAHTFASLHTLPMYYFGLLIVPIMALLPDYTLKYARRNYWPTDANIIQEDQYLAKMRTKQGTQGVGMFDKVFGGGGKSKFGGDDVEALAPGGNTVTGSGTSSDFANWKAMEEGGQRRPYHHKRPSLAKVKSNSPRHSPQPSYHSGRQAVESSDSESEESSSDSENEKENRSDSDSGSEGDLLSRTLPAPAAFVPPIASSTSSSSRTPSIKGEISNMEELYSGASTTAAVAPPVVYHEHQRSLSHQNHGQDPSTDSSLVSSDGEEEEK